MTDPKQCPCFFCGMKRQYEQSGDIRDLVYGMGIDGERHANEVHKDFEYKHALNTRWPQLKELACEFAHLSGEPIETICSMLTCDIKGNHLTEWPELDGKRR
jgi:hypothetical protein